MMKILEFFFHKQAPPVPFVPANEAEYFTRKILGSRMYLDLGRPFSLQGVDVADLWRTAPAPDKKAGFGIRQWHVTVAVTCLLIGGLLSWALTADPVPGNANSSTEVGSEQATRPGQPGELPIQPNHPALASAPVSVPSPLPNLSMVAAPYPAVGEVMPGGPLPAPMPLSVTGRGGVQTENQPRWTPGSESDKQPDTLANRSVLVDEGSHKGRTAVAHDGVGLAAQPLLKLADPVSDKGFRQSPVAIETAPRVTVETGRIASAPAHSKLVAFSPDGKSVLVSNPTSRVPVKVSVGEAMPDGRQVESIDPVAETVRLAGGVTIKME